MFIQTQQFTPMEAAALVGLKEMQVRKEIEYQVIDADAQSQLSFPALVYLQLVRRSPLSLQTRERNHIYKRIVQSLDKGEVPEQIEVIDPVYLRFGDKVAELQEKVIQFIAWKNRLSCDPDIMGGAITFSDSRLTVRHIGGMVERGVAKEEILEDYPYLDVQDLEFARLFVRAYPLVDSAGGS